MLNVGGGDGTRSYGKPVRETDGKGDVELSEKDNMRKDVVLKGNTMRGKEERCWNGGYMLTRSDRSGGKSFWGWGWTEWNA